MFYIGDFIIYSAQGVCRIDDIHEKTYLGVTKKYYTLHPLEDSKLKISIPVDNEKVSMLQLVDKEQAEKILESFKLPGAEWIERDSQRNQVYSGLIKTGNRKEITQIANILMRKKIEVEESGKKFHERDKKLLTFVQEILFVELAHSLNTTFEAIYEKATEYIRKSES